MPTWVIYAFFAAVLYGLHQVFTKLAAYQISDGIGGFIVELSAVVTIALYLLFLWFTNWNQRATSVGVGYSILTGICVGAGTVCFFLLFQKDGPLSAVPAILAGGAALMAIVGFVVFKEPISVLKALGIALSLGGLWLLKCTGE